jgi:hypothetical protein
MVRRFAPWLVVVLLAPQSRAQLELTQLIDGDVRVYVSAPAVDERPCRVIVYATPNGNTLEQTLGSRMAPGLDWHYDIQHIAAQTKWLQQRSAERLVLVVAQAIDLSWPAYRARRPDANARIRALVDAWRLRFGGPNARMTLTGHSGGGSFIFGVIEGGAEIPECIDRIAPLDANYAFDDALHTAKLVRWLKGDVARQLVVLAYDDREITLDGKKVVGPDGGTFRATDRMAKAFASHFPLTESAVGDFTVRAAHGGRVRLLVHQNPLNKILHTALVGEMNGLIFAQTVSAKTPATEVPQPPRRYEQFMPAQPQAADYGARDWSAAERAALPFPQLPGRPADALGGRAVCDEVASAPLTEREARFERELLAGNFPQSLRIWRRVELPSGVTLAVLPDWLSVGSDADAVHTPLTPATAQRIADAWGCIMPTPLMVDAIDVAAAVHVTPQPFGEPREAVATFVASSEAIQAARGSHGVGLLLTGGKKDVVLNAKLAKRPNRVAIYGWRQLSGEPIQPLTTVHVSSYVDYSHGIRLVAEHALLEGEPVSLAQLLTDPQRCALVSNEGVISPSY